MTENKNPKPALRLLLFHFREYSQWASRFADKVNPHSVFTLSNIYWIDLPTVLRFFNHPNPPTVFLFCPSLFLRLPTSPEHPTISIPTALLRSSRQSRPRHVFAGKHSCPGPRHVSDHILLRYFSLRRSPETVLILGSSVGWGEFEV